jgi:hypothetical protein
VDETGNQIWSVIPGVSYSKDPHAFIQVIHANSGRTDYVRYPIETFTYSRSQFRIGVGTSSFSSKGIKLDLKDGDLQLQGTIEFEGTQSFPSTLLSPGIMGWYSYVPFMECYHGVVSMQHELKGSLSHNGNMLDFDRGKGYIEKDWGKSMPTDWIWIQSNHFRQDSEASFMLSLARIPWLGGHFPGFLSFLKVNGRLFRFATYNRSKVEKLFLKEEKVHLTLRNRKYQLGVKISKQEGGLLKAPRHGAMDREIQESIISTVSLELKDSRGNLLFSDLGRFAGLEIVGDMTQYYGNID